MTDLGHVATLDLTPQRKRDQEAKAAAAGAPCTPPNAASKAKEPEKAAPTASGSSLYSLIKRRQNVGSASPYAAASPHQATPPVVKPSSTVISRARPAPVQDSFDDLDDSFDSDPQPKSSSTDGPSDEKRTSQSSLTSQSTEYR